MDSPVLRSAAKLRGFLDEHDGWVGLFKEQQIQTEGHETHDCGDVFRPAPTHVGVDHDEAAEERSEKGAGEYRHGEDCNGKTTGAVVKHVREHGTDDGEGTGAEETSEEAAEEDGLKVFACCGADLENREAEHGDEEREFSAPQL